MWKLLIISLPSRYSGFMLKNAMDNRYPVPDLPAPGETLNGILPDSLRHRVEEDIRRSRFITSLGHAPDRVSARRFIEAIRREFPDATHNCWAYAAGRPGDTADIGQSDDGEPHGTAGRPMLDQILRGGVGELVVVITRYFGGIKLGTGGLARAYRGGVSLGLESLPVTEKTVPARLTVCVGYERVNKLYRLLSGFQAVVMREDFGENVTLELEMPADRLQACREALIQVTDGSAVFIG